MTAATSITTAFPGENFSQPQYQVLARIASGEDVRSWHVDQTSTLLTLIGRCVIEAEALTGRLYLLTPEAIAVRQAAVARRLAMVDEEIAEIDAAMEIGERMVERARAAVELESANIRWLMGDARYVNALAVARAAHSEAVIDLAAQQSAQRRRLERHPQAVAEFRDLDRERMRLDIAARRRAAGVGGAA